MPRVSTWYFSLRAGLSVSSCFFISFMVFMFAASNVCLVLFYSFVGARPNFAAVLLYSVGRWCLSWGGIFSLNCCTLSFSTFVYSWFFPCSCFLCSFVLHIDNTVY